MVRREGLCFQTDSLWAIYPQSILYLRLKSTSPLKFCCRLQATGDCSQWLSVQPGGEHGLKASHITKEFEYPSQRLGFLSTPLGSYNTFRSFMHTVKPKALWAFSVMLTSVWLNGKRCSYVRTSNTVRALLGQDYPITTIINSC